MARADKKWILGSGGEVSGLVKLTRVDFTGSEGVETTPTC